MTIENTILSTGEGQLEDFLLEGSTLRTDMENLTIDDLSVFKEKSHDSDNVYLESIFALIEKIHKRIDNIEVSKMGVESMQYHFTEIYKMLCQRNAAQARNYIKTICGDSFDDKIINEEINFKKHKYDALKINVKQQLKHILEKYKQCIIVFMALKEKIHLYRHNELSKANLNVLDKLKQILHNENIVDEVIKLKKINKTLEIENKNHKHKIESQKNDFNTKELQEQNVKLQDEINRLTERNHKLKKECVLCSNEISTLNASNKRKQRTIEKQCKIIEVMQGRIGDSYTEFEFPIDELNDKIRKLRIQINNEQSASVKALLLKELIDYEKRLKDFESLKKRKDN